MNGKAKQKSDEGVMVSDTGQPDTGRRNLGAMLLAAIGVAGIAGCVSATGEGPEKVHESAAAIAGVTIGWADTVLGAPPNASRTGDLALYEGGSIHFNYAVVVVVKGCVTPGDGGGGLFYWDTDTVTADDGGTVIVPMQLTDGGTDGSTDGGTDGGTGGRNGCWKRIYSGAVNLAWFGAGPAATGQDNAIALTNALKNIASAGGGTIEVSQLYPLGYTGWLGIRVGIMGGVVESPIHGLTLEGTTAGAGFVYMSTSDAPFGEGMRFTECEKLTIRNITLDGRANTPSTPLQICFLYLYRCNEARIEGNRFIYGAQGSAPNGTIFTFWSDSGKLNRYENNLFQYFAGVVLGYLNDEHKHDEGALFIGNKLDSAAPYTTLYTVIRNGVIANNSFSNMPSGALIVQNGLLDAELTANLAITGNSIKDCDFGIRTDSAISAVVLPMQGITITGNVIERCQYYAISITKAIGLTITGNVIRDCAIVSTGSYTVVLNGVSNAVVSDNSISWTREEIPSGGGISFNTYFIDTRDIVIDGNSIIDYAVGIQGGPDSHDYGCSQVMISNNLIQCRAGFSSSTPVSYGIEISQFATQIRIFNNNIGGVLSAAFVTFSTCQLFGNQMPSMILDPTYDMGITYYWEEENGRKTYRPNTVAPTAVPAGVTAWRVGDLQHNSGTGSTATGLAVGDPIGWVYTGTTLGWRPFGVIA